MSKGKKGDPFAGSLWTLFKIREDLPIMVQGLLIQPGEEVLVMVGTRAYRHTYAGVDQKGKHWTHAGMTTAEGMGPGPYTLEDFRHPDVLTAFIKQVDVEE